MLNVTDVILDYQGIFRNTAPPIKVRVNPKGEMEIMDGNHRAQLWEDANMTHAPAWVIDERGKGIESLSEDERAERAELEEEERQSAQQKTPAPKAEAKAGSQIEQAAKPERWTRDKGSI